MGVDLQLLPFEADFFSHTILNCERRRELWDAINPIEAAEGLDVPTGFQSYLSRDGACEETHYGTTIKTPYGDRLKSVTAGSLKALADHEGVTDNQQNRAVWAYLACLPDETKVALFWS